MTTRTFAALLLCSATATLSLSGCTTIPSESTEAAAPAAAAVPVAVGTLGLQPGWMDRTARPGDDFYAYANGQWMRDTQIPADRSSWGGFAVADKVTEANLEALVAEIVASDPVPGSDAARIKAFYTAYLDTAAIEAAGMAPVMADIKRYEAIASKAQLARALGGEVRADVDPINHTDFRTENLFGIFVSQALKSEEVVPYVLQGGLGMPDRQYYLAADAKMAGLRTAYKTYIADMLAAAGFADARARAARIYDLEMKIAQAHAGREESYDWAKAAALWSQADFAAKAPGIDWSAFFAGAGLSSYRTFDAYHPEAITRLSRLVGSEPLRAWKDWLIFHQINTYSSVLPQRIDDLSFGFYGKQLSGIEQQRPRDKRAVQALNGYLGGALGRLYVERHFPASAKAETERMVGEIKQAFVRRIEALDWMASETKRQAIEKTLKMEVGVGYPDSWTDYAPYAVSAATPYENLKAGRAFNYRKELGKIGKPQDKREWWMNPQLVNAVNLPVQNAMNFPAAILQPPFFDEKADPAYNYGAIGAVIGHEISHGFDNNGAAFDASGLMRDWWTDADKAQFDQSGKALAAQYDAYEALPGLNVRGELTLGENIADLAGIAAAYDAYRHSLGGKEAPVIDGFTGDQRFFLAYAQTWATKYREATLRERVLTDGHAPGQFRALTVRNLDAWYRAFGVEPGDALYLPPDKRVKVW